MACHRSYQQRQSEGTQPEYKSRFAVAAQAEHIHFETGQKHEVKDTYVTENLETAVAFQQIEPMRTNNDTGNDKTYDVGNAETIEQDRRQQDDSQNDKENKYRIGYGKCQRKSHKNKYKVTCGTDKEGMRENACWGVPEYSLSFGKDSANESKKQSLLMLFAECSLSYGKIVQMLAESNLLMLFAECSLSYGKIVQMPANRIYLCFLPSVFTRSK